MNILANHIACITDPLTTSNCYIISMEQHALIIDPNLPDAIISHLTANHLYPELILLTHEHCDHISGLNRLREIYHCPVLASTDCSNGIQNSKRNMSHIMETYLYFRTHQLCTTPYPEFTCAPADITFVNTHTFTWNSYHCACLQVPGHTLGSTCFIFDHSILFSGDYFIPGEQVITRLPGGDPLAYEKKGRPRLQSLPLSLLTYPGHGSHFILTEEQKHAYGL
ncbi:MBL fold metallo-hydrolase [Megasphaera sp. UPII 135-E]|uniref:MBL fold metallo-hydrolase n=1 Tax=Megasphaera sp. UPII 135-E TaxID=1000569 RepID=UPI00021A24A1|nr:MBL fold metallo-hydrolase [Megasphaera sp. UPII 135-E]EGS33228.1 metallo-beta-lactamase domain protein [Megasphaera sp. UPII 135-E]MUP58862.1 MBL fold metallo-hydrolase [Veillonellaceae bacterium M2-4]